jgi:S1-C subfamily serine protease
MSRTLASISTLPAVVAITRGALGLALVAGLAGIGGAGLGNVHTASAQTALTTAEVADLVNPAVVTIVNLQQDTSSKRTFGQLVPAGSGSGFIIDADGHVVTNNHVVEGGDAFAVTFLDGVTVEATLVGADPWQDVAVLELQLAADQELPGIAIMGDSADLQPGDEVLAIGTPFGEYANSVTVGYANALDRVITVADRNGIDLPNLIQHDADIYPGNSGGPLVDMKGEVVGINVAGATEGDIGFAIEIDAARPVIAAILADGEFDRAWLGISGKAAVDPAGGLVQQVLEVTPGTPAAAVGIQPGDVITAIDGQPFTIADSFVASLLFEHLPGDTITLTVERGGQTLDLTVTLGARPIEPVA